MRAMEQIKVSPQRSPSEAGKKRPRRLTQRSLRNQALAYLARYAASRWRVERFLRRRVERAEAEDRAAIGPEEIAPLLDDLERLGLIDDCAFAETKARSFARRGLSARAITARLREQGIDAETAESAVATLELDLGSEAARAHHYCKRRRLGPYRLPALRKASRERDLAALGRRGFSYEIARQVIDSPEPSDDGDHEAS